jgi:hypothetical protein
MSRSKLLTGIAGKLSLLMGGAVLVSGAAASSNIAHPQQADRLDNHLTESGQQRIKSLPAKLILKQQSVGSFKMIAAHTSHSSHSSHASHASHSSHSSSAH